jgi:hypothetical protein
MKLSICCSQFERWEGSVRVSKTINFRIGLSVSLSYSLFRLYYKNVFKASTGITYSLRDHLDI